MKLICEFLKPDKESRYEHLLRLLNPINTGFSSRNSKQSGVLSLISWHNALKKPNYVPLGSHEEWRRWSDTKTREGRSCMTQENIEPDQRTRNPNQRELFFLFVFFSLNTKPSAKSALFPWILLRMRGAEYSKWWPPCPYTEYSHGPTTIKQEMIWSTSHCHLEEQGNESPSTRSSCTRCLTLLPSYLPLHLLCLLDMALPNEQKLETPKAVFPSTLKN